MIMLLPPCRDVPGNGKGLQTGNVLDIMMMEDEMEQRVLRAMPTPGMRYRRRLAVLCPNCGARACDISPQSRVEQFLAEDDGKPPWEPDIYLKCSVCKVEIFLFKKTDRTIEN